MYFRSSNGFEIFLQQNFNITGSPTFLLFLLLPTFLVLSYFSYFSQIFLLFPTFSQENPTEQVYINPSFPTYFFKFLLLSYFFKNGTPTLVLLFYMGLSEVLTLLKSMN